MDQVSDHTKCIAREDLKTGAQLDSSKPLSSNTSITHSGPGQSQGEQRVVSDSNIQGSAPIHLLPHELLVTIFELCISQDTPVQAIVSLTLVCTFWRNIVEGTPSLWRQINGRERLAGFRKALAMAKDAPLDLTYCENIAKTDPETFFGALGDRTKWRSLDITTGKSDVPIAALKKAPVPNLESLWLRAPFGQEWTGGAEVTLFGGEPASTALKEFCVDFIPVMVDPLRLSGLRSLDLKELPIISAEEVLRILRHSPKLEHCYLDSLFSLDDFGLSEPDQELLGLKDIRKPITQLPLLQLLGLCGLPISFVHFFFSAIRAPNLTWLSVDIRIDEDDQSPKSELFTPHISHLSPTLTTLVSTAKNIRILSYSCTAFRIYVGSLIVELNGVSVRRNHMDETLEWIFSHLDPHQQALPASLSFYGSTADPKWLTWLSSTLKVTKLQLQTYSDHDRILDIISLLSQPLVSTPTQWPLPDLKSIETNVVSQYGKSKILEMVKARACFIQAQGKPEGGDIALQPFKEIRLRGGMRDVYGPYSRHVDLLNELQEAARGAEIWWDDFKWTGSENSARQ